LSLQDNLNNLLPAPPAGSVNVQWQGDPPSVPTRNISAYFPNIGGVDQRTTTIELITVASQGKLVTFNNSSAVGCALNPSGAIAAAAVNSANAGTGYAVNDTFNISGGTGGTGHVTAESGGVVSTIAINNPGIGYSVSAGNATTATSGVGTGLEIDISTVSGSITNGFLCFVENLGTGALTLTPGSGTINGSATLVLSQAQAATLFFDGTNWWGLVVSNLSSFPYDIIFTFASLPAGSTTYPWITFTRAVTFPGNFSGASGKVLTNPTSSYVITVNKNGSSVGTITIATGGAFTFATSGGSAVTVAANDYFTLTTPTADPTLANLMITLAGTR
jgi:hypothetical protein